MSINFGIKAQFHFGESEKLWTESVSGFGRRWGAVEGGGSDQIGPDWTRPHQTELSWTGGFTLPRAQASQPQLAKVFINRRLALDPGEVSGHQGKIHTETNETATLEPHPSLC